MPWYQLDQFDHHLPGVVALATSYGRLYAATSENVYFYWYRSPHHPVWYSLANPSYQRLPGVVALAASDDRLYAATAEDVFWHPPVGKPRSPWRPLGRPLPGVVALAVNDTGLYAATAENVYGYLGSSQPAWHPLDNRHPLPGVVALAAGDNLYVLTGPKETVVIPPGRANPFAGEAKPPQYVIDPLLVYYPKWARTFAVSLITHTHTRLIRPVPPEHQEMADYSVMITRPEEVPEAEKAALRARHIAVVEWQDGMTIERIIQEVLAQWQGQTTEEIGQVTKIEFRGRRLGIYL